MPSNIVKKYAKQLNKPVSEIEEVWDKAKEIAKSKFKIKDKITDTKVWAYTTKVFIRIVENKYNIGKETISIESIH